jgi:hypothetical protein
MRKTLWHTYIGIEANLAAFATDFSTRQTSRHRRNLLRDGQIPIFKNMICRVLSISFYSIIHPLFYLANRLSDFPASPTPYPAILLSIFPSLPLLILLCCNSLFILLFYSLFITSALSCIICHTYFSIINPTPYLLIEVLPILNVFWGLVPGFAVARGFGSK